MCSYRCRHTAGIPRTLATMGHPQIAATACTFYNLKIYTCIMLQLRGTQCSCITTCFRHLQAHQEHRHDGAGHGFGCQTAYVIRRLNKTAKARCFHGGKGCDDRWGTAGAVGRRKHGSKTGTCTEVVKGVILRQYDDNFSATCGRHDKAITRSACAARRMSRKFDMARNQHKRMVR